MLQKGLKLINQINQNNLKGVDYRCVTWVMSKSYAINRLNNSELDDRGSL